MKTPTQKVADYWGGLVQEGVIDNKPMYTPEWNTALNTASRSAGSVPSGAPACSRATPAQRTASGQAAPMPQWDAAEPCHRQLGRVLHRGDRAVQELDAAAKFATWLNTDAEAVAALVTETGIYPARLCQGGVGPGGGARVLQQPARLLQGCR